MKYLLISFELMWSQFFDSCGRWNDNRALVDELPQRSIVELDSVRPSDPSGPGCNPDRVSYSSHY